MFDYECIMPCPQNDFADIKRLFFGHDFGELVKGERREGVGCRV